ncbi:hypothetical protein [Mycobacterium alsense]|uniref:hypothetical protein n=1 Tax=Mycobacterium alsense TaxID=324058 RepID=UPI000A9CE816|nr:hypothetical protein [Mycobacterium alsense]
MTAPVWMGLPEPRTSGPAGAKTPTPVADEFTPRPVGADVAGASGRDEKGAVANENDFQ